MKVTRQLKQRFPNLIIMGTAYSYLQDFLPHVAQAAVREGWVDMVGLGRMILTYPEILWDAANGNEIQHKRVCRTFSDCTTASAERFAFGLLSAGQLLQKFRIGGTVEDCEGETMKSASTNSDRNRATAAAWPQGSRHRGGAFAVRIGWENRRRGFSESSASPRIAPG